VRSGSPYEARYGFSRALRIGDRVWVAGTAPIEPDGSVAEGAVAQAGRCFDIIEAALAEVGAATADVVRTRMFVASRDVQDAVGEVHGARVGHAAPVATMVVAQLLDERWLVEIEAEALVHPGAG
jgi:enamine deaminase RidA (YjgF/YER057c/UK114 family)